MNQLSSTVNKTDSKIQFSNKISFIPKEVKGYENILKPVIPTQTCYFK